MNDSKFAFRQLLKNSGFTAVAVLTLMLGTGLGGSPGAQPATPRDNFSAQKPVTKSRSAASGFAGVRRANL
jgi:hypothetical protein